MNNFSLFLFILIGITLITSSPFQTSSNANYDKSFLNLDIIHYAYAQDDGGDGGGDDGGDGGGDDGGDGGGDDGGDGGGDDGGDGGGDDGGDGGGDDGGDG